jgi:hypothetical protein
MLNIFFNFVFFLILGKFFINLEAKAVTQLWD